MLSCCCVGGPSDPAAPPAATRGSSMPSRHRQRCVLHNTAPTAGHARSAASGAAAAWLTVAAASAAAVASAATTAPVPQPAPAATAAAVSPLPPGHPCCSYPDQQTAAATHVAGELFSDGAGRKPCMMHTNCSRYPWPSRGFEHLSKPTWPLPRPKQSCTHFSCSPVSNSINPTADHL